MNKLLRVVLDILTFGILEIVLYVRKRMAAKTPETGDFDNHPADGRVVITDTVVTSLKKKSTRVKSRVEDEIK